MAATGAVAIPAAAVGLSGVLISEDSTPTGPQEGENTYRWAVITGVAPLRLKLDGEALPLPLTPESLVELSSLAVGVRVWTQLFNRRVIILGASAGGVQAPPVGSLMPFAGAAAPAGWLLANGAAVSRTTYAALFTVCGTTYGVGDGSTTFNLPNMVNRVPVGAGGTYARGATGGAATVTLTDANLSAHTHSFSGSLAGSSISGTAGSAGDHGHSASGSTDTAGYHSHTDTAAFDRAIFPTGGATTAAYSGSGVTSGNGDHSHGVSVSVGSNGSHTHSVSGTASGTVSGTTGATGGATAHENMPPFLAVPYIIRAS